MKSGKTLVELATEIERRAETKKDFIAPVGKISMSLGGALVLSGAQQLDINTVAHSQLADYTGIPQKYYRRMQAADPSLLAENVNHWMHDESVKGDKRMIRTLDGKARAFLSNAYRALENEDLANAILPVIMNENYMILSADITETRLYIKAVDRSIERDIPSGKSMGDGGHTIFDTVSPGITISNSEVGMGSLLIERSIYTRACTNLALFGTVMRKFHTGSRAVLSDDVYALLTDDTKRTTDAALWGQVKDLVAAALKPETFDENLKRLANATEQKIEGDVVEVVEVVGKKFGMVESERKGILRRLIEGGDLTRYGMHSAITRHSADVESYDRATELERTGGEIITLDDRAWSSLLKQAA